MVKPKLKLLIVTGGKEKHIPAEILSHFSSFSYKYANRVSVASGHLSSEKIGMIVFIIKMADTITMHRFASLHKLAPSLPIVVIINDYETIFCANLLANGASVILLSSELSEAVIRATVRATICKIEDGRKQKIMNERYRQVSKATNDMLYEFDLDQNDSS